MGYKQKSTDVTQCESKYTVQKHVYLGCIFGGVGFT